MVSDYVRAIPQVPVVTMGGPTVQYSDRGTPALFHAECFPGGPAYRQLD
jgi:hypothetical protein